MEVFPNGSVEGALAEGHDQERKNGKSSRGLRDRFHHGLLSQDVLVTMVDRMAPVQRTQPALSAGGSPSRIHALLRLHGVANALIAFGAVHRMLCGGILPRLLHHGLELIDLVLNGLGILGAGSQS